MAALTDEAVPPDAGRAKKREDLRSCFCNIVDSLSADDLDLFHSLVLAKPPSSTSTPSITSTGSASEAPLRVKPTFLARLGLEPASPLENSSEPSAPLSSYRSFLTEHSAALDRIIEDLRGIIPTTQHVVGQSVESEGEAGGSDQVRGHEEMQQEAIDIAQEGMSKFSIEKDIAQYIKKSFDERKGPTWHCIVGRNFGSFVTHETKHFIYFYLGHCAILLFKTQ